MDLLNKPQPPGKNSCGVDRNVAQPMAWQVILFVFLGKFCLKVSGLGFLTFPRLTWSLPLTCPVLNMSSQVRKTQPWCLRDVTALRKQCWKDGVSVSKSQTVSLCDIRVLIRKIWPARVQKCPSHWTVQGRASLWEYDESYGPYFQESADNARTHQLAI